MAFIYKILEISTGHLPREVAEAIDSGNFHQAPAMRRPEGWLFPVPQDPRNPDTVPGISSKAFTNIMIHARENNCEWVLFDRDVSLVGRFPTFDW